MGVRTQTSSFCSGVTQGAGPTQRSAEIPVTTGWWEAARVIVIDPEGRIAGVIPRFLQMDPTAYEGLAEIIDGAMREAEPGN